MPRGHHQYSRMTEHEADEAARGSAESEAAEIFKAHCRAAALPRAEPAPTITRRPTSAELLALPLLARADWLIHYGPGAEPPLGERVVAAMEDE